LFHKKASPKKASPKKASAKASPKKASDKTCAEKTTKKYVTRQSPPFPANQCQGHMKKGNDGNFWQSTRVGAQKVYTWKKV
jgi:hypothetical protein